MQDSYIALARKYRPSTFAELVGQEVLVKTLTNAILLDRIPHAIILTGTRGIGKTTTARILARSINCIGKDGISGPTISPCQVCHNCTMIAEYRHQDVIEMDAASHTSVNDIRVIIENAAYKPVIARYKIYIIDEVHMLSTSAFNALLKIIEEPPANLKFIFATTEIRKIPVTILSRCQQFNLKRVSIQQLTTHYQDIANREKVTVNIDALHLIAKAADGSVRDGLSMLDQAIALGNGQVTIDVISNMLGLNNQENILRLFKALVSGEIKLALQIVAEIYTHGVEPITIANDLLEVIHIATQAVLNEENRYSELEMQYLADCKNLPIPYLSRAWQVLIKGIEEIKISEQPLMYLEMVIVKLGYLHIAKTPEQILQDIVTNENTTKSRAFNELQPLDNHKNTSVIQHNDNAKYFTQEELLELLYNNNELELYYTLYNEILILDLRNGYIKINYKNTYARKNNYHLVLQKKLFMLTGTKWVVEVTDESGATMHEQNVLKKHEYHRSITNNTLVQEMLKAFAHTEVAAIINKKH